MPQLFFTSDHHFGHENILKYCRNRRTYASLAAMNEDLAAKWNAVIQPEDQVWYLGDFSLKFSELTMRQSQLHGYKHMIVGNHDSGWKSLTRFQQEKYQAAGFSTVAFSEVIELQGLRFLLAHYPYQNDNVPEGRDAKFAGRAPIPGAQGEVALLHGHIHDRWRAVVKPGCPPSINVGVDAWGGYPVNANTLVALVDELRSKPPGTLDIAGRWRPD